MRISLHGVAGEALGVHGDAPHGIGLEVADADDRGRQIVFGPDDAQTHGVEGALRGCLADFVVQVRSERGPAVARVAHRVALPDGEAVGGAPEVDLVAALAEPFAADEGFEVVAEAREVAVDGRGAVVEGDVERPSVTRGADGDARDVAVGHGDQRFAFDAVGLDIHTRVEMVGAHLSEVGRVESLHAAHGKEVVGRIGRLGVRRTGCGERGEEERDQKKSLHGVSVFFTSAEATSITAS